MTSSGTCLICREQWQHTLSAVSGVAAQYKGGGYLVYSSFYTRLPGPGNEGKSSPEQLFTPVLIFTTQVGVKTLQGSLATG